jgi:hypothetical protein
MLPTTANVGDQYYVQLVALSNYVAILVLFLAPRMMVYNSNGQTIQNKLSSLKFP